MFEWFNVGIYNDDDSGVIHLLRMVFTIDIRIFFIIQYRFTKHDGYVYNENVKITGMHLYMFVHNNNEINCIQLKNDRHLRYDLYML